jgi:hypothetical protein
MLLSRLDEYSVGNTVRLRIARGDQEREIPVRLQIATR